MELNLQPLAPTCFVTGQPFAEGQRVASFLVREPKTLAVLRYDLLESAAAGFAPPASVACRWVQVFKPHQAGANPERALKLTAENLFLTLADPATEPSPENTRLLLFLALMLERKRLLRPRGRSADGAKIVWLVKPPGGYRIVMDGDESEPVFRELDQDSAGFSPDGRTFHYLATRDRKSFTVRVTGVGGRTYELAAPRFIFPSPDAMVFLTYENGVFFRETWTLPH